VPQVRQASLDSQAQVVADDLKRVYAVGSSVSGLNYTRLTVDAKRGRNSVVMTLSSSKKHKP
jgi:hypothetical protein